MENGCENFKKKKEKKKAFHKALYCSYKYREILKQPWYAFIFLSLENYTYT